MGAAQEPCSAMQVKLIWSPGTRLVLEVARTAPFLHHSRGLESSSLFPHPQPQPAPVRPTSTPTPSQLPLRRILDCHHCSRQCAASASARHSGLVRQPGGTGRLVHTAPYSTLLYQVSPSTYFDPTADGRDSHRNCQQAQQGRSPCFLSCHRRPRRRLRMHSATRRKPQIHVTQLAAATLISFDTDPSSLNFCRPRKKLLEGRVLLNISAFIASSATLIGACLPTSLAAQSPCSTELVTESLSWPASARIHTFAL